MIERIPLLFWPPQAALTILIFHRVLAVDDPLRPDEPNAAQFEQFVSYLARHFHVLPLVVAVDLLKQEKLPRRACCITFDDGYADNLTVALPILEAYGLPATVFVATRYLNGGRMFNDSVVDSIASARTKTLDLRDLKIGSLPVGTTQEKKSAIEKILSQVKFLEPDERDSHVRTIVERTDCAVLPSDTMLTTLQLKELFARGVEIGGHTDAHTILTTLEDERAKAEMQIGKRKLEEIIGSRVRAFAYPNGKPGRDYLEKHAEIARSVGFEFALTTAHGICKPSTDLYQLPRFLPWGRQPAKWSLRLTLNAYS